MQIEHAARLLRSTIGATVGMDARPRLENSSSCFFEHSHTHYDTVLRAALHAAPMLRHGDVDYAQRKRQGLKEAWSRFFQDWDVLFCPVSPTPAFVHDHSESQYPPCTDGETGRRLVDGVSDIPYAHQNRWAGLTIFPDLPVTVLPVGKVFREGVQLPVGMQIVGPFGHDLQTIEVGRMLENVGEEELNYRFQPPSASCGWSKL